MAPMPALQEMSDPFIASLPRRNMPEADRMVRCAFDEKHFSLAPAAPLHETGLFAYPQLDSSRPRESFHRIVDHTLHRARLIYARLCNANVPGPQQESELKRVIKNLDRLSDTLCGVIDLAELIRTAHPDQDMVAAANEAYENLCSFMNLLNTEVTLYEVLKKVMDSPSIARSLSPEEKQVALVFLRDFEKSGIHLPELERAKFVSLSDSVLTQGRQFLQEMVPSRSHIDVEPSQLEGLGPAYISSLARPGKGRRGIFSKQPQDVVRVPLSSRDAHMVLKFATDESVRRLTYTAAHSYAPSHITTLEELLHTRAELAHLVGMESYGHMALQDKMAQTPDNAVTFLRTLAAHHRSKAMGDVKRLQDVKQQHLKLDSRPTINVWDRDFYAERVARVMASAASANLSSFFSLGTCLQGFSRLCSRLYGVSLVPVEPSPGEVWHPDVRKLEIVDEDEGGKTIGTIYCDLFHRNGKSPNAAHFTVRCSRRVDDDDLAGDGIGHERLPGELSVPSVQMGPEGKRYQLPVVVLLCDFGVPGNTPSLLSFGEVETLWHEMGHAIHSMLGRTEYHNVSGTRCSTDFVELPSIIMEHFISSPSVLSLFARHHYNDAPLPMELFQAHRKVLSAFDALEQHSQIMMALLDQVYHSPLASSGEFDSTRLMYELYTASDGAVVPPAPNTPWQGQFGHLFNYGATYYSYVFDSTIANKIWKDVFRNGDRALDREQGERFKREVLRHGGSRNPWEAVGALLGNKEGDVVARGDTHAIERVGTWGIS